MKYFFLLTALVCQLVYAQPSVITGRVQLAGGQPAAAATVSLYRLADTVLVKLTVTDTAGVFGLKAEDGAYLIGIKAVGRQAYLGSSFRLAGSLHLQPVVLQETAEQLAGVQVTAQQRLIEVRPDKTVFNVASSLAATGLSAFEVLRKAPGILIDNQNSLMVEGKTGARIYIDGKVSLLSGDDLVQYLRTLQSTDVEAIEIITQPSARYDAAGTAGIINLRLKKNRNYGTNGSLTGGYAVGIYPKYNGGASFNHRSAKWNVFANGSTSTGRNKDYLHLNRWQNGYQYDQQSFNTRREHNDNLRTGLYYSAGTAGTFGIILNGNFSRNNHTGTSQTAITNLQTGQLEQVLDAGGFTTNRNRNLGINLNYRYAGKKQQELLVDADYGYYRADRNNRQPNTYRDVAANTIISRHTFRMITPVGIRLAALKADYSRPAGKWNIGAGLKTSLVQTRNSFDFYDVKSGGESYNTTRSNRFNYTEGIHAVYINAGRSWNRLQLQAGLRAEQTVSDGRLISTLQNKDARVKRRYLDWFPTGGLTWQANGQNSLGLQYSRRIDRPDYRSLNPFEYNSDELSFSKGNPYLQPQYTQTVKLSHTYQYTLTTALSYSYISGFFAQITDTVGNNRNFISPQNIASQQVVNLNISYAFNAGKWWNVYTSLNAYRGAYRSANPKFVPVARNTFSFYGQNSFTLPAGYRLELSGWYSSPSIWGGTYRTRSMGSLDIALQKSFLENVFSLRAAVSDLLYTSNWTGTSRYGQLYIEGSGGWESRQARLSLTYHFGKKTVKAAADRPSGAEEEKGRLQN